MLIKTKIRIKWMCIDSRFGLGFDVIFQKIDSDGFPDGHVQRRAADKFVAQTGGIEHDISPDITQANKQRARLFGGN